MTVLFCERHQALAWPDAPLPVCHIHPFDYNHHPQVIECRLVEMRLVPVELPSVVDR